MTLPKIKKFTDYNHYPDEAQPTTDADMQDYMQNQNDILNALTKRLWQPQTAYNLGDIVASDAMADGLVAVCTVAGVTSDIEPEWGVNEAAVIDNSCTWIMRPAYCYGLATENDVDTAYEGGSVENSRLMSMGIFSRLMACVEKKIRLLAYPVGSLYWSKKSTSPATLFGGTWTRIKDKFILAAGDSYAQGATGGSATVTLTTEQLPAHNHSASSGNISLTGYADITSWNNAGFYSPSASGIVSRSLAYGTSINFAGSGDGGTKYNRISVDATHSHTITVNNTGSGNAHDNMPPYVTYYCWERTA